MWIMHLDLSKVSNTMMRLDGPLVLTLISVPVSTKTPLPEWKTIEGLYSMLLREECLKKECSLRRASRYCLCTSRQPLPGKYTTHSKQMLTSWKGLLAARPYLLWLHPPKWVPLSVTTQKREMEPPWLTLLSLWIFY